ncbi:MAG: sensor histidine kinase [Verrucomicrobia bacterium]|nr:sensor histidine kinase [Verrucomicrobiota bacterium]
MNSPTRRVRFDGASRVAALSRCATAIVGLGLVLAWEMAAAPINTAVRGLPFSRTYSLEDVGYVPRGSRLNFDSFGRIAVIHDGVYAVLNDTMWLNVADATGPGAKPMAEVVHTGYGRCYYGGRASWGIAEFGPDGNLHAKPLVPPDPPAWTRTTTFDEVTVTSDGVYFSSRSGVVFWDFARKECQLHEFARLARVFAIGNKVFVSSAGRPLHYIDVKARTLSASPGTVLDGAPLNQAVPLDAGRALVSFLDGRMFVFDGQNAVPWAGEGAAGVQGRVSALRHLVDGNIALAISRKGLFVLSPDGAVLSALTAPQYHQVASIASRESGVLWVLTEDSIEKILYAGGLTSFGQRQGVTLRWPVVAKCRERTFVASARVLYEAVATTPGAAAQFERVEPQPPGGAVSLAAAGSHLLVGNSSEIFEISADGRMPSIARLRDLGHLVMTDENHCFAIGASEIALLEWDGARWFEPVPRIPGLPHPYGVHRLARSVWIEMSGDGVARVSRKGDRLDLMVLRNESWTKALWVNVGVVGDTVVLSPIREARRFFDEKTETWCERPQLARLLESSTRWLSRAWQDETGTIWGAHSEGLVRFTPHGEEYVPDSSSYDLINDRYPIVNVLPGNDIWVTASRSLHHVEQVSAPMAQSHAEPVLVSLTDTRRNVELLAKRVQREPLQLDYAQNSLTFRFFAGSYAWRRAPVYEYKLNAADPWTTLETGSLLPLPGLRDGKYNLQVRAAEDRAEPGPPMVFAFEILPPWHRTWPAYTVYVSALLLGVFGITRWSGHLTRRRNRVLEQLVQDRTGQLETAMTKLNEETRSSATLAERDRLAGEIHDSVQQGLSGAILQLDTTLKSPAIAGDLRTRLNVVRNMVSYARQEVQHAVWDMNSPLLEGNDLGEALRKLTTFTASSTVIPTVAISGTPLALPRVTTHHLLRVAQEATTNAVRHASAHRIEIALTYQPDSVSLTISDDGVGFDPDGTLNQQGHFGLRGMRGRVKKFAGELTIRSKPGEGTVIHVRVPLSSPPSEPPPHAEGHHPL